MTKTSNVLRRATTRADAEGTTDEVALARLRAGDEHAFAELVTRYHGRMVRLAAAFVPSRAVAEEVVQEAWVGVLEGLDRFEGRSSLRTWIFRIVGHRARTRGARERRMVSLPPLAEPSEVAEPAVDPARFSPSGAWGVPPRRWEEEAPDQVLINAEAVRRLERAIANLPAQQRVVVTRPRRGRPGRGRSV